MNLSTIYPLLNDRRATQLSNTINTLELAIGLGLVPNALFTDAKGTINRVIEDAEKAFFDATGMWSQAYDADALLDGAHTLPTKLKRAQKAGMTRYADFVSSLLPLRDILEAAKPLIRKKGDMTKVKTAKQIADEADQMTCQCCGRGIFAALGTIAHHGYERPGHGYQTASCMGAKELPFEVDRAVLAKLIVALQCHRDGMKETRAEFAAEQHPIRRGWSTGRWNDRTEHTFDFTRANFRTAEATAAKSHIGIYGDFDDLLARELASRDRAIASIEQDIAVQQARYDGWKQTHKREGGQWVAL